MKIFLGSLGVAVLFAFLVPYLVTRFIEWELDFDDPLACSNGTHVYNKVDVYKWSGVVAFIFVFAGLMTLRDYPWLTLGLLIAGVIGGVITYFIKVDTTPKFGRT